jgi:hypothetical protein
MQAFIFLAVVAAIVIAVGWLAWPESEELDLAPRPSRLKFPGILVAVSGLALSAWGIWSTVSAEELLSFELAAPLAAMFVGGCTMVVAGVVMLAAAAIVDAVNGHR